MNNSDMPAMPTHEDADGYYADTKTCKIWRPLNGLTKLEYAAIEIMAAMVRADEESHPVVAQRMAEQAVQYAEAIFSELEKKSS